jgi:hypothetical protein
MNMEMRWLKLLVVQRFLYHIHLEAEKQFSITTDHTIEYAAFLPSDKAVVKHKGISGRHVSRISLPMENSLK